MRWRRLRLGARRMGDSLKSLWHRRALILELARRDIEQRHRGSYLGPAWRLVYPLVQLAIYTFIFGVVFRVPWPSSANNGLASKAILFYCGLAPVVFFTECVGRAPSLITGSRNYVKRVVFPLEVLPLSAAIGSLLQLLINMCVIVAGHILSGGAVSWTLLLAPLVLVPLVLLALGISWLLASVGVLVRDVSHGLVLLLQLVPLVTPVFYPIEVLPDGFRALVKLNPLTAIVESFRRILLWQRPPDWLELGAWTIVGVLVVVTGLRLFNYTKQDFADVV